MKLCQDQIVKMTDANASFNNAKNYVIQAANLQGISIPAHQINGVTDNFLQIQVIAQPVLDFHLPESLEPLPRFEP